MFKVGDKVIITKDCQFKGYVAVVREIKKGWTLDGPDTLVLVLGKHLSFCMFRETVEVLPSQVRYPFEENK